VVCKIFGENLDTLAAYAQQLAGLANGISGAVNLYVEQVSGMPQVLIHYNRDAIAQYNLSIGAVNRLVNASFAGQSAGMLFEGERRFDLVVRLGAEQKKSLQDIRQLLIPTPSGTQVPLYLLANVELKDGPNQIQREDAKRRIVIGFNVRNRDVQSIVNELQQKVSQKIKFPPGYYVTYGGSFENLTAAKNRLMIAVPLALLMIVALLYMVFDSGKLALLIFLNVPLATTGGIFALWLRGLPFSISAGVGFIALFGVAVLNGVVLVSYIVRLRQDGNTARIAAYEGALIRLRPVLMTALVAMLGFIPMAFSHGAGAEVQKPLATVVIGGLVTSSLLTLLVLPAIYPWFDTQRPQNTEVSKENG
jgi:cobalt-zinc-cadmium resistance protein CzcA